jgi:sialic acid synthase SpsE
MSQTYIIAEVGSTHMRDRNMVRAHVANAKAAGADAVKFQWTSDAKAICERRRAPEYLDAYKLIEFPGTWLNEIAFMAHETRLDFMCTVYLPKDIEAVAPLVKQFKIASFEARDTVFIRAHDRFPGTPILLSTGMLDIHDVASAVAQVGNLGGVLHCVSAYPTPPRDVHLDAIYQLRRMLAPVPVGFSDHTRLRTTGGLAVAAGAEIIEVHARLEDTPSTNADYAVAHDPQSLAEYVQFIRHAEAMVGHGVKRLQECEQPMVPYQVRP